MPRFEIVHYCENGHDIFEEWLKFLEVQRIQRRINEAKSRIASMSYWASLVDNAEKTAKDGKNAE